MIKTTWADEHPKEASGFYTDGDGFYAFAGDKRPLTDETLKELGFELVPMYPDSENTTWSHPEHRFEVLQVDGKIESIRLLYEGGIYKTVGKLKMLIEALKGE